MRSWVACYFNGTRENSYDIQQQLGVKIAGDQKLTPFPHWTLSTLTPGKRYSFLTQPVSDWFVGGLVAQSLEPWHPPGVQTVQTLHSAIDFYYNQGFLINFYSHTMSTGLGDAGALVPEYVVYCQNTNLHPRIWPANAALVYQWWVQRSNAQVTATYSTNGFQSFINLNISGSTSTNTAIETYVPFTNGICSLQVSTNGVPADANGYRTNGQLIRVLVGTSVTNVSINFYPLAAPVPVFSENFDAVTTPGLPSGWTTSASGSQSAFITQATNRDTVPNAAFCPDAAGIGLTELVSPSIAMPIGMAQLSFMNNYDLELSTTNASDAFDGGVLEIRIGTNAFTDILAAGGSFISGGYTAPINTNYGNPLGGRLAWSGTSGAFIPTVINLPLSVSGQNIQLRWRCGSDGSTGYSGWRIDTIGISSRACLCCTGSNSPPVLPAQANRTTAELTALSVTNTASDPDNNALSYFLINPPPGASININGIINWTPSEAQGPGVYTLTTVVTDNGFPVMSATNSFTVTVTEINTAPVLPVQPDRTISEMVLSSITNAATDSDLPANSLTYSLVNPPPGAAVSSNGIITWMPTEAQGPGTYTLTTIVNDNGSPPLSATNSFNVFVAEVNSAPTFVSTPPGQTAAPGAALTITNSATDSDVPQNNLSYSLLSPPSGAAISSAGVITWTPSAAQNHTTNLIRTVVTDDGSPPLSTTNAFTIIVNGDPSLSLNSTALALEGCLPTNNAIDPGETVTVLFSIRNNGLGSTTNLVATLLQTNGVIPAGNPQNYGVIPAGGGIIAQPFTFASSGSCGGSITAVLQLQDGAANLGTVSATFPVGPLITVLTQNFDNVTAPALPAGWTTTASGVQLPWFTTNTLADTPPNAAFSTDGANVGVNELVSPAFTLPSGPAQLSFRNNYSFEYDTGLLTNGYDGGVLEIRIGTNSFVDITNAGGIFLSNGYNRKIDSRYANPLTNRWAWSGVSNVLTTVSLPPAAANQTVQLRWRAGTDNGNGGGGWRVDSIAITGYGCCFGSIPVLAAQTNRTISELTTLTVTNTATDSSAPPGGLAYSLTSPPPGAAIDTNGIITWTPSEAQGPGTYTIITVVTDHSYPPLGATNSFTVTVNEVNSAPALTVPANQTINELSTLNVSASATDSDVPANTLTFSLLAFPPGLSIDPSSGAISWTPTEAQGPSTNVITVVVSDNGTPPMSATNSFTVTVNEVNSAPSLTVPADQTINELSTLNVSASASDPDIPANTLSFSLLSPPPGMSINPATGAISWTPTEAQGPSTNVIAVVVSDNGTPPMSATNSFIVTVNEVNSAPSLTVPANQTINELSTLNVSASASDPDLPANTLTFSLLSPPTGVSINPASGGITWTPTEAQGPSTNLITVTVTDNGAPPLSATNSFTVTVLETNSAPVLPGVTNYTIDELTTLTVTNSASDSDVPANTLTYSLLSPPVNASIDTNGVITFSPDESQGPGAYTIITLVTDDGSPRLGVTNSFTVTVNEVNTAPVLAAQPDRTINALDALVVTNAAIDADLPANTITYKLLVAPGGGLIDTNGVITWTAPSASDSVTNDFITVATDDGVPALSATNHFSVVVNPAPASPLILAIAVKDGTASVSWTSVPGSSYRLEYKDHLEADWNTNLPPVPAITTSLNMTNAATTAQRFYRVVLVH